MVSLITTVGVGILIIVIGMNNMKGNISSIHEYHRRNVTEENAKPFGKLVGLGTCIVGIAIIIFGVLLFLFEQTQLEILSVVGTAALIAGIVVGLSISFYAMKKYNGGIFS